MTAQPNPDDLLTSADVSELLGQRVEPLVRAGRITPYKRAGRNARSALLFLRSDVDTLVGELRAELSDKLAKLPTEPVSP